MTSTSMNPPTPTPAIFITSFLQCFFLLCPFIGKEITLLMQTLNTLSTPEEKLAGLCKKYAELVSLSLLIRSFCYICD